MGRGRKRVKRSSAQEEPLGAERAEEPKTQEEVDLETSLFGRPKLPLVPQDKGKKRAGSQEDAAEDEALVEVADDQLFVVDTPFAAQTAPLDLSGAQLPDDENDVEPVATSSLVQPTKGKKSAWHDPADEALSVSLANNKRLRKLRDSAAQDIVQGKAYEKKLRQQYEKANPAPQWAAAARQRNKRKAEGRPEGGSDESEPEDGDSRAASKAADRLLRRAGTQVRKPVQLQPERIDIKRLADANQAVTFKSGIRSIGFHPHNPLLFVISKDRRLRLFRIDGKHNTLLKTVHVPEMPLAAAQFHPSGDSMLLLGHATAFLTYNLKTGKLRKCQTDIPGGSPLLYRFSPDGSILAQVKLGSVRLLDWHSGAQYLFELQVPSSQIKDLCWLDQHLLATFTATAEVFVWDVRTKTCISRWRDEGGFGTQATEACDNFVAISSTTGVVNVYKAADAAEPSEGEVRERKAIKALLNFTTAVDTLRFDRTSQLLAIASSEKADALRLVHTPTMTVYSNWPTDKTPLGRVSDIAFSSDSRYIAVSNHKSHVLLYNLKHFGGSK